MAKVSNPFAMSCVLSAVGLAALVANSLIIVRYGRRRVLLTNGLIICGVLQLIIAIAYDKNPGTIDTGKVIIGLTTIYISAYNVRYIRCITVFPLNILTKTDTGDDCPLCLVIRRRTPIVSTKHTISIYIHIYLYFI